MRYSVRYFVVLLLCQSLSQAEAVECKVDCVVCIIFRRMTTTTKTTTATTTATTIAATAYTFNSCCLNFMTGHVLLTHIQLRTLIISNISLQTHIDGAPALKRSNAMPCHTHTYPSSTGTSTIKIERKYYNRGFSFVPYVFRSTESECMNINGICI